MRHLMGEIDDDELATAQSVVKTLVEVWLQACNLIFLGVKVSQEFQKDERIAKLKAAYQKIQDGEK